MTVLSTAPCAKCNACAKCKELGAQIRGWCTFSRLHLTGEFCFSISIRWRSMVRCTFSRVRIFAGTPAQRPTKAQSRSDRCQRLADLRHWHTSHRRTICAIAKAAASGQVTSGAASCCLQGQSGPNLRTSAATSISMNMHFMLSRMRRKRKKKVSLRQKKKKKKKKKKGSHALRGDNPLVVA